MTDDAPWAVFIDIDAVERRFDRLQSAFPDRTLHAVAVKANPVVELLERLVERGAGLEVASGGEIEVASRAGAPAARTVFDSPAKTRSELEESLCAGVAINADNLDEIERIADIGPPPDARIGVRINPVVGAGDIDQTSVATASSKFGVSLTRQRRGLLEAFRRHRWLNGLHVHTGSQGLGLSRLVEGVRRCVEFADDIHRDLGDERIETIDIGGGLPVAYHPTDEAPDVEEYATRLRAEVPALFSNAWRPVTEFGRWIFGPCGFAASRVEYVNESPTGPIAIVHFGADLMLRTAYRPDDWHHEIDIFCPDGHPRSDDETEVTVAGPLCFSGDVIARNRRLPRPRPGDLLMAHDVGAYTFSMWSRYCSRPFPRIFGVRQAGPDVTFEVLHPGEDRGDVATFWSATESDNRQ